MVNERDQLAEAILNHALEIICLLTVEDFIVVKKHPDGNRCKFSIRPAEIRGNICDSSSGCPELLFTLQGMEEKTQEMIEDLARNIVCMLNRQIPKKDAAAHFSKDEWRYLRDHGEQSKNNNVICTIDQSTVQQSTEKSHPFKCCIKEEVNEELHPVIVQPTVPVQQVTEKSHPIKRCMKEEAVEELHPITDEYSVRSLQSIVKQQPRTTVQECTQKSYPFKHCIKEEPVEEPLPITELPAAPMVQNTEKIYPIECSIKEEPNEEPRHVTDRTSVLPSPEFIPGSTENKLCLPTVIVHIPFVEAQTAPGFSFLSSCNIIPEPGGGSAENTMNSMPAEPPNFSPSSDQELVYNTINHVKEEPEERTDMSVSGNTSSPTDCRNKDEDYLPPKTHQDQRSLPCNVCGKVFGNKSSLEKHMQIHTGQRPFPCSECDKRFSCRNHLTTHMRVHSGERPFPCNVCGRRFFKHQHLVLHQVVHTGEKPFSCPVCGKGFTRQSSVVKHSGMHAEKKPFVCKECGKSYCQYASLVVHQRLHSGEKPFVCKYCEKAFTCKATMLKHQSSHTG